MDVFEHLNLGHYLELVAALAGSYYLFKTKDTSVVRYFVWFLWLTVVVEILGLYTALAYFSDYEVFSFIKDTPFERNYWLFNCYSIIAFGIYIGFFTFLLKNNRMRRLFQFLIVLFVISAFLNLIISDVFFRSHSTYTFFIGTILVLFSIGAYYFELLRSDEILSVKYSAPFYISVGALVYHLGFVPLVIYNDYFHIDSPDFVRIYTFILLGINYFLYSLYTIGFIICSKERKSY